MLVKLLIIFFYNILFDILSNIFKNIFYTYFCKFYFHIHATNVEAFALQIYVARLGDRKNDI